MKFLYLILIMCHVDYEFCFSHILDVLDLGKV